MLRAFLTGQCGSSSSSSSTSDRTAVGQTTKPQPPGGDDADQAPSSQLAARFPSSIQTRPCVAQSHPSGFSAVVSFPSSDRLMTRVLLAQAQATDTIHCHSNCSKTGNCMIPHARTYATQLICTSPCSRKLKIRPLAVAQSSVIPALVPSVTLRTLRLQLATRQRHRD